jgi:hypothetical protein
MGSKFISLGDSTGTATAALTEVGIGNLEDVYISVDGIFSATANVEVSSDGGTTWESYSAPTTAKSLIGPLPPCHLVRGKPSAHASGTISYRLSGNVNRSNLRLPTGETLAGLMQDIVPTVASQMQTITAIAKANIAADGGTNDYFAVTDGVTTTTFELKKGGGSFVPVLGRTLIDCTGVTTAIEVAVLSAAAIAAAYPTTLSVPVPTTAVLSITAADGYTIKITEHVNDGGFLVGAINQGVAYDVCGCGPAGVWVKSADFVGTWAVSMSFDGGATWAYAAAPAVVASGVTSTLVTCPCRASHVRIEATTYTSGTLSARYGAHKEPRV